MLAQYPAQPELLPDLHWSQAHRVLVVTVAANRVAQEIAEASGHARAQVPTCRPQDDGDAGGHVFASMLANPFHHRQGATVADGKSLPHSPRNVQLSAGRAVEQGVAGEYIATQGRIIPGADRDHSTGQALAHILIGLAQKPEVQALDQKSAESLPGAA